MTRLWLVSLIAATLAVSAGAQAPLNLAPYVPTPHDVVARMLKLAGAGADDVVYDLGSGDGRIVIAAARDFGARGVGIEISAPLVARAEADARAAGVDHLVSFRIQDALTVDVSPATIVTLYLLSASNVKLRPLLGQRLEPGARIVAHNYPIGDWEPDVIDNFSDAAGVERTLYLWRIKPR